MADVLDHLEALCAQKLVKFPVCMSLGQERSIGTGKDRQSKGNLARAQESDSCRQNLAVRALPTRGPELQIQYVPEVESHLARVDFLTTTLPSTGLRMLALNGHLFKEFMF